MIHASDKPDPLAQGTAVMYLFDMEADWANVESQTRAALRHLRRVLESTNHVAKREGDPPIGAYVPGS